MDKTNFQNKGSGALEAAREYVRRGFRVIPISSGGKIPNLTGWQNLEISEAALPKYFNGKPQNIGVLLGVKSGGLVDIDLDSWEAVELADCFLPETRAVFGRKSKRASHRLYICADAEYSKFNNPLMLASADADERKKACIVEIRTSCGGKGIQTVFPPGVHESGEAIEWQVNGEPSRVSAAELSKSVGKLAAASLLAKCWRGGIRHELAMAVSGALLRHGFDKDEVRHFIKAICTAANDEETADRLQTVEDTARTLADGEKAFGLPKLAELTDEKIVKALCDWLEIERTNRNEQSQTKTAASKETVKAAFNFTTLDELLNEPEEKHSYVWENTLISGGISICSAKPKVGKSTLARNLAVAVSKGADFLGRTTKKGKIIYLCLEEKRSEVAKHFKKMDASGQDILVHTGKTPEDALPALKSAIAENEPVLVIIDPLSRILRVTDFNDYATMARGLEPFIDLAREFNTHILALHHDGKGGREGNDSILGSTAIFGAVDCHLNLKKRESNRTVWSTQRYGLDLPETVIELDAETGVISEKGDLQNFILETKKNEILESIAEKDVVTEAEIKDRVGGNSQGIISKAIRTLVDEEKLFRRGEGKRNKPYLYSKNPENLECSDKDFSANEKPTNNADKFKAESENEHSGFVGFSNSENLENLESPEINRAACMDDIRDFYSCPNCTAQIPMAEDVCKSCGKRAITF